MWDVRDPENPTRICNLYSFRDGSWAVVDAHGRFDASNGGQIEWLHWVVGLETIALWQLRERYYEPGLLTKLMGHSHEELREVPTLTSVALYPTVELIEADPARMSARLRITNRGGGIGRVVVWVNGKEVSADARGDRIAANAQEQELALDFAGHVFLTAGENEVRIQAYNREGYLSSRDIRLVLKNPQQASMESPHLWAIVVGISDYQGEILDLRFAAKDAEDFANALRLGGERLFSANRTHVTLLAAATSAQHEIDAAPILSLPTRQNIRAAFESLHHAKSSDILVVYLAGHGVNQGGQEGDYYFLTAEARTGSLIDPAVRQQTAISSRELTEWIREVPALKQVLILDTCAAGRFVDSISAHREMPSSQVRALERMRDRMGLHILAGSAADAVSYESSVYGQGLLTYTLLLGMQGAALREDEFVDIDRLFAFSADKVPELAMDVGGIQRPRSATPLGGASFDIGRLTRIDRDLIPLSAVRPLMLPALLDDTEEWRDTLGISRILNDVLREQSARGRRASLVFVDTREHPRAYSLKGRYTLSGNAVVVESRVFWATEEVDRLSLTGRVDDLENFARELVERTIESVRNHWSQKSSNPSAARVADMNV